MAFGWPKAISIYLTTMGNYSTFRGLLATLVSFFVVLVRDVGQLSSDARPGQPIITWPVGILGLVRILGRFHQGTEGP